MNVVLILADDLGYGDVSYNNSEFIETKNIDSLKNESITFNDFDSTPLCAPSRVAILTGQDFFKTEVWHVHGGRDFISRDIKLLSGYLKDKNYSTGIFKKWHSGKTSGYLPH